MRLEVTKLTGTNEITLCEKEGNGYTGTLSCNVSIYTGTFKAVAYRTASPEVPIVVKTISTSNTIFKSQFGLVISGILWLAIVLTGIVGGPIVTIILGVVGLIPALFLGSINFAVFTGFAVIGGIVLHFIKRGSGI
jgi:LytS/YehU family sensor histidine kinase